MNFIFMDSAAYTQITIQRQPAVLIHTMLTCSILCYNDQLLWHTNGCKQLMLHVQQTTAKFHDNILSLYDTQT